MKKNILFVINNLNCGGAEKALISLLETIDYEKYKVDLLLFKKEGIFLDKVPQSVNLLNEPDDYKYFDMSIKLAIRQCLIEGKFKVIINRILAGYIFKTENNRVICEQRVWKYISKTTRNLNKKYDIAIGYLEKNPIYFCVDKVNADKKIGFIHSDYDKLGMDSKIDEMYFEKLDNIVTVSESCERVLKRRFKKYEDKISYMYNIVSTKTIEKLSNESIEEFDKNKVNIVSVGRLSYPKGFDIAIDCAKLLDQNNYNFKWYVIGDGEDRQKLQNKINKENLQDKFILLGLKDNPYPYIKKATIYVQPSRFEGKSIAIDEAKILRKPIVVTNFSTAKDQILNEKNGLIVEINSEDLYIGIKKLINDKKLQDKFIDNLSKEKLGTEEEITKLYTLFN